MANARREITLLLIGQTGGGKSTFINALANYFTFDTPDAALEGPTVNLIPLEIEVYDDDYQLRKIQVGEDYGNEKFILGSSGTQKPRTYVFELEDCIVSCINTPGIGDVRGKEQDRVNFKLTMDHLSRTYLTVIHGILFFVEPHNPRLNEYVVFCIDELLTHFHKNACKNIVFLFTKSRIVNFKPGRGYTNLNALIRENNYEGLCLGKDTTYFVDNEVVQLQVRHSLSELNGEETANFRKSWNKSREEFIRLIGHVSKLEPHSIKDTISLNEAKCLAHALVEPMFKICSTIEKNINLLEEKKTELANAKEDLSKVNLTVSKIVVNCNSVSPRLVCSVEKCTTEIKDAKGAKYKKHRVCHENCHLPAAYWLWLIPSIKRSCEIMNKEGKCTKCGCHYKEHKYIKREYVERVVYEEIITDRALYDKGHNSVANASEFIVRLKTRIAHLQSESDKLIEVGAILGIFLSQNSMRSDSDVFEDRLKKKIDSKKRRRESKRLALRSTLENYQTQKGRLRFSSVAISPNEVRRLIGTLYELKTYGQFIQSAIDEALNEEPEGDLKSEVAFSCRSAYNKLMSFVTYK